MKRLDDIKKYYIFRALIKRYPLPIIALFMIDVGVSVEQVALIFTVSAVLELIFEVPSGAIADAIGHKKSLLISMSGQAIAMALYLGASFEWVFAGYILYYVSGSLMTGSLLLIFFERLKVLGREHEYRKLPARAKSVSQGVGILFMATAGLAYMWQWWLPFTIGILQFVLAGVLISTFGKTANASAVKFDLYSLTWKQIREALKIFSTKPVVLWALLPVAFFTSAMDTFHNFDQILLSNFGLTAVLISFVYVAKRFVGMLAPFLGGWLTKKGVSDAWIFSGGLLASGLVAMALGLITNPIIWIGLMLIAMALYIALGIVSNDVINHQIDSGARATVLSFGHLASGIVHTAGVAGVGVLLGVLPLQAALLVWGIVIFIFLLLVITPMHRAISRA